MKVEPIRDFSQYIRMQQLMMQDGKVKECLLVQLLFYTNLRISDALLIKWSDVILEDGSMVDTLRINEKKTSKQKWLPMTEDLKFALINFYYKYKPRLTSYLFRSESNRVQGRNQPWHRGYAYRAIVEYAKKAGIKANVGSHTLRKTWGYQAYHKKGIDIYEIMRMLGHQDVRTTEIYCGIDDDRIRQNYEEVSNLNVKGRALMDINALPEHEFKYKKINRKKKKKRTGSRRKKKARRMSQIFRSE